MSKNKFLTFVTFLSITLVACQNNDNEEPNGDANQSNSEEVEPSKPEEDSAADDNETDEDLNQEETEEDESSPEDNSNDVTEQIFDSEEEAINAIENYREVDQTNTDLGYGIMGFIEGAAGHQYVSWNEGNWLIEIDFPSDPQYAVDTYENGEAMAKAIVEYLESNTLPPPSQRGVISIRGFSEHPETLIRWQQGETVYEIDQKVADPIDALQIAVDYQKNN